MKRRTTWLVLIVLAVAMLAGCAPSATQAPTSVAAPTSAPAATQPPVPTQASAVTTAPEATRVPSPTIPSAPATPAPTPTRLIQPTSPANTSTTPIQPTRPVLPSPQPTTVTEQRMVELEWPAMLRLGESDVIRLSLVPYQGGYVVTAEFPEHDVQSEPLPLARVAGFTLSGVARLDGVGFNLSPAAEIEHPLPAGETVTWRWTLSPKTSGQQRLSITLALRWTPEAGNPAPAREQLAFSHALTVQVNSVFGMSQTQAMTVGFIGLVFGAGLGAGALALRPRSARALLRTLQPRAGLAIEPRPGIHVSPEERGLLGALFDGYDRLALEGEFLSGYSGARTFLALPVHPDGRADAYTIVKIGSRASIQREAGAYERYVKDRLPPVTARIQQAPVTLPGSLRAAVRYTFIAEPGKFPTSLRLALLANGEPELLWRLFETFGPNWWMQRRAYAFRWALEYDHLLPPHLVLEPLSAGARHPARLLDDQVPPERLAFLPGDLVTVGAFHHNERRGDGVTFTLLGRSLPGRARLRVRWLSDRLPTKRQQARVMATRTSLLQGWTTGVDLRGLPDPCAGLETLLGQTVQGTQSIIHGDLNLENILVGPGGFTWLIDFSETREGHPLMDFAHLAAEIIAHVYAPVLYPEAYLARLKAGELPLLSALEGIAGRCLFNPVDPGEYHTALRLACLGALKYPNLDAHARALLYLTAAWATA